ncbi:MAG: hypothetical protein QOH50_3015 [Kribbellaceae bacterium]|jgi:hypothetical protein|nr:hypothetical protein [Kribbellaceae bacterium]
MTAPPHNIARQGIAFRPYPVSTGKPAAGDCTKSGLSVQIEFRWTTVARGNY